MCSSDTRATVLDWLVGDGELAQVMATHLRLKRRKIKVKPFVENTCEKYSVANHNPGLNVIKKKTTLLLASLVVNILSAFCQLDTSIFCFTAPKNPILKIRF